MKVNLNTTNKHIPFAVSLTSNQMGILLNTHYLLTHCTYLQYTQMYSNSPPHLPKNEQKSILMTHKGTHILANKPFWTCPRYPKFTLTQGETVSN